MDKNIFRNLMDDILYGVDLYCFGGLWILLASMYLKEVSIAAAQMEYALNEMFDRVAVVISVDISKVSVHFKL